MGTGGKRTFEPGDLVTLAPHKEFAKRSVKEGFWKSVTLFTRDSWQTMPLLRRAGMVVGRREEPAHQDITRPIWWYQVVTMHPSGGCNVRWYAEIEIDEF